jgi:hypothetical protein
VRRISSSVGRQFQALIQMSSPVVGTRENATTPR